MAIKKSSEKNVSNDYLLEIIEAKFTGLHAQMKANCDITDMVHQQVLRINGRVRELELGAVKRQSYWKLAIPGVVLLFIVLYVAAEITGIAAILKHIL